MTKRNCIILGRDVGTTTNFEVVDTLIFNAESFVPHDGVDLPKGDVSFDLDSGIACLFDDEGDVIETKDIVSTIAHLPQVTT